MTIQIRTATPWGALLGAAVLAAASVAAPAAFAQSTESQSGGKEYTVVMSNMQYGAIPSGVKVGDTIIWVNHDTVIHSVTARDHSFDLRINPGQTVKMPVTAAGRIVIYCLFHPDMRSSITVAAK